MRGRAIAVALPALVVLALVAVVAVAATGIDTEWLGRVARRRRSRCSTRSSRSICRDRGRRRAPRLRPHTAAGDRARGRDGTLPPHSRSSRCSSCSPSSRRSHVLAVSRTGSLRASAGRGQRSCLSGATRLIPTTPDQEQSVAVSAQRDRGSRSRWSSASSSRPSIAYVVAEPPARAGRPEAAARRARRSSSTTRSTTCGPRSDPRRAIIAAYARLERVLAANGIAPATRRDLRRVPSRAS